MMIGWGDVYKVVVATAPLYVALLLGYGSVKWWRMLKAAECDAVNRFNCYFILPFFTFRFTSGVNPYSMNFRFLAADVVAKAAAGAVLAAWANIGRRGNFAWAITSFSLYGFNNTLVVGVPLLKAMYGAAGEVLVVQSSVIQSLLWFPILLFLLEFRRARRGEDGDEDEDATTKHELSAADSSCGIISSSSSSFSCSNFRSTMKIVGVKLGKNPNCYACALGLVWSLLANKWNIEMPSIIEGSIMIMGKAGSGVAMFSMGMFMGLQEKIISCGVRLSIYSMVLRFVCAPVTTGVGCVALGLRSTTLSVAILQAALPQSITCFVFAHEYNLHANLLSTAVIFGTIVSLPLLIAYYAILDALSRN
ncbi:Auxin efflux carrier family protein [Perilla frutescens var. hirtella]|uniref:Auxin efflux carrier component n=1 Tax=Perilla frutescens var. hirtella TaxID=608512 RepID=A0AAD4JJX7_PERFH|nr:Auxin efflux carrier family protein [Perilla frutescens var. hirtella]